MRATELSYSPASYSRSIISTDVSALVELVGIPAFFKKGFCQLLRRGACPGRGRGPWKQHQY